MYLNCPSPVNGIEIKLNEIMMMSAIIRGLVKLAWKSSARIEIHC